MPDHAIAVDGQRVRKGVHVGGIMGDQHDGDVPFVEQGTDLAAHPDPEERVQRGEGLVQQQHTGRGNKGAGKRDALPLAPGNFTGIPLGQMPDLETLQKIIYGFAGRRGGAAEQGPLRLVEREFHIPADRQMREQGVVLKNIPEMALTGREIDALLRSIQHIVPNLDVSAVRPDQPRQRLEGKRLAGTGVPEQDKPPGGAAQGHVEGKTVAAFPPRGEALAYLHIKHQRPPAFPPNNLSARTRMVRHRHDVNTTSTVACSSLPA